jgi:hypothetical protein
VLFGEVDERWAQRFPSRTIADLRSSLGEIVGRVDVDLPEYVPIVAASDGMVAGCTPRPRSEASVPSHLTTLLAQALLAYTLEFEAESELSLALSANFVRVLDDDATAVRDLPARAGVSKEASAMALGYLTKAGYAARTGSTAATMHVRLSAKGAEAQKRLPALHAQLETAWNERFGTDTVDRLRASLEGVLEHAALPDGLRPYPDGWRASKPYSARTEALLDDPRGALPHYPLVLHRGGWPDGS